MLLLRPGERVRSRRDLFDVTAQRADLDGEGCDGRRSVVVLRRVGHGSFLVSVGGSHGRRGRDGWWSSGSGAEGAGSAGGIQRGAVSGQRISHWPSISSVSVG